MNNTPVWIPKNPQASHMWQFMRFVEQAHQQTFQDYNALHAWSIEQPALFWQSVCDYFGFHFTQSSACVLDRAEQMWDTQWFPSATFNFADKLLSRNDDHPALVSLDERGTRVELSYKALRQEVNACAAGLKRAGVVSGDRVAGILPNVSYTVIAMLATASIGAIWAACSSDFGVSAAVDRLGQINPTVLFVCDGHDYHGKTHLESAKIQEISGLIPSLTHIVVCPVINAPFHIDTALSVLMWDDFVLRKDAVESHELPSFPFDHPLYILFSSGTTGKPKCIIHGAGNTLLQHIKELGLHTDIHPNDNLFFYTTCGWMMWNWMVSTLALGATLTLYEGSTTYPNHLRLFKLIDREKVTVFGTSPKFLSSLAQAGIQPASECSLDHLRCILSTGAPLLPEQYDFVATHISPKIQLSSISGGTDIVSCFALGNPLLPVYPGELQCIGLGMAVEVYDESGHSIQSARGELVCTQPFPSMPIGFWNDPNKERYKNANFSRFENIWAHGDFAEITPHHGLIIYGRSDAVLNPGGVRIGTAEIYRQIEKIPGILDSVVIGQNWEHDVRVILFVKLGEGVLLDDALIQTIRKTIRTNASPRHVPSKILQVRDIPRTISGKLVEVAVRQAVHGEPILNVHSLANPEALDYFKERVELCV